MSQQFGLGLVAAWIILVATDVRRARRGQRLWTANYLLRDLLQKIDARWTWVWLALLTTMGFIGLADVLASVA